MSEAQRKEFSKKEVIKPSTLFTYNSASAPSAAEWKRRRYNCTAVWSVFPYSDDNLVARGLPIMQLLWLLLDFFAADMAEGRQSLLLPLQAHLPETKT